MYTTATLVNPYNMMVVLNMGSHAPFFYSNGPAAINFGSIGYDIGNQVAKSIYGSGLYYLFYLIKPSIYIRLKLLHL